MKGKRRGGRKKLCGFGVELDAVPDCDLCLEDLVDEAVLLDHGEAAELGRDDGETVHAAASAICLDRKSVV